MKGPVHMVDNNSRRDLVLSHYNHLNITKFSSGIPPKFQNKIHGFLQGYFKKFPDPESTFTKASTNMSTRSSWIKSFTHHLYQSFKHLIWWKHSINYDSIFTSITAIPFSIIHSSYRCSNIKLYFKSEWMIKFKGLFWTADIFHLQIPI